MQKQKKIGLCVLKKIIILDGLEGGYVEFCGWIVGWVDVKAILRTAYRNQKLVNRNCFGKIEWTDKIELKNLVT